MSSQFVFCTMKTTHEEDTPKKAVGGRSNTWGAILFQKDEEAKSIPMVKRSKRSLSTRSLEICTERLGSETGAEGFSSYPGSGSEGGDMESEEATAFAVEEAVAARKTRPRSFPPPIQTLSQGNGGGSLSMYSRRDSGRLVVEAVSIPSEKNFEARREEGRLILTLATNDKTCREDEEGIDEEVNDELVMEMESGAAEFASESIRELYSRGAINVQKLNEPGTSLTRDSAWFGRYYEAFNCEEEKLMILEQSLSTPLTLTTPVNAHDTWESRRLRERDGYSAPLPQGWDRPSRTSLLWEMKCISTS